jgi:hypothetical protein
LVLALVGFIGTALLFVTGSRVAKSVLRERAQAQFPAATLLDIVATPMPANPFCWSMILLEREGRTYSVRLGRAATFPAWLDVEACPYDRGANPTTPLTPIDVRDGNRLRLTEEYRASIAELAELSRDRCEVRALLRFARVPYFTARASDQARVIGDVRYDRHPDLDFSDFRLSAVAASCPPYVPAWLPPRADLLSDHP